MGLCFYTQSTNTPLKRIAVLEFSKTAILICYVIAITSIALQIEQLSALRSTQVARSTNLSQGRLQVNQLALFLQRSLHSSPDGQQHQQPALVLLFSIWKSRPFVECSTSKWELFSSEAVCQKSATTSF